MNNGMRNFADQFQNVFIIKIMLSIDHSIYKIEKCLYGYKYIKYYLDYILYDIK